MESRVCASRFRDRNTTSSRSRPATSHRPSHPLIVSAECASGLHSNARLHHQPHICGPVTNVIRIDQHTQIPIEPAASAPISRGFLPWRLSDDGPGASRIISMGCQEGSSLIAFPFSLFGLRKLLFDARLSSRGRCQKPPSLPGLGSHTPTFPGPSTRSGAVQFADDEFRGELRGSGA
jgi:hypothetical protein